MVWLKYFNLILVLLSVVDYAKTNENCQIRITNDLPQESSPLYLQKGNNNYYFIIPNERGIINLRAGEEIILACPGKNNGFLQDKTTNLKVATCSKNSDINIFGKVYPISKITCVAPPASEIRNTNVACGKKGGNGLLQNIGFNVQDKWLNLFETCYDSKRGEAIYAVHTLVGKTQRVAQRMTNRPFFSTQGTAYSSRVIRAYKKENQIKNFQKLFPENAYFGDESFLSKGHLAPSRDFPLNALQAATFYFVNVVPEWLQVNSGNWNELEYLTRKIGMKTGENYQVVSGASDILELPNKFKENVKLHLESSMEIIPVPKYIWKVVIHPLRQAGIAFVALNNPFAANGRRLQFCRDVCDHVGFNPTHSQMWTNGSLGLVTCCEVNEFKRFVNYLPDFGPVNSILRL